MHVFSIILTKAIIFFQTPVFNDNVLSFQFKVMIFCYMQSTKIQLK